MRKWIISISFCVLLISAGMAKTPYIAYNIAKKTNGGGGGNFILGIKGGVNFTWILPTQRYSFFSPTNASNIDKTYSPFYENIGKQIGFIGMYPISSHLFISLQPTYAEYNYHYENTYAWAGGTAGDAVQINYLHTQSLRYFEFPILLKMTMGNGRLKPYVQGGAFYGMLEGAAKNVDVEETLSALGGNNLLNIDTKTAGVDNLYIRSNVSTTAGVGIQYDGKGITVALDAHYNMGVYNIINESMRFSDSRIMNETFDVLDDTKLTAFAVNLSLLVPLNPVASSGSKGKRGSVVCPAF